jgi:glycosyltransferase involved in cell wall biosynthesis
MRIVHVIDYFQPQLGYQETFLAREHSEAGHDVFVVTSDRYQPFLYAGDTVPVMGKRIKGPGFFLESGVQVWRLKVKFEYPNLIWLSGLEAKIQEIKPDLVIVHGITNLSAVRTAMMKNRSGGFRLVYDDHAIPDNTTGKMRVLYPLFRWTASKWIQKAADGLVAILPATRDFMHKKYGIPQDRIAVIPLGADTGLFRLDTEARRETRRKLRFNDRNIVIIYTGKIIPARQVSVLVEATAGLMEREERLRVLIVGSGDETYVDQLKQDIESKGLSDKFTWVDAVQNDRLYRYYSAADISVWPFGASIGMREAMACSLPIIIGADSSVTELVEGNNGLLFSEGDAADLAAQIEKLLDTGLRKKMGAAGRRLVEERFSWRVIAQQFLEFR